MKSSDIKAMHRFIGTLLIAEGGLMALCLIPALHFADGTVLPIALSAVFTLAVGILLRYRYRAFRTIEDRRISYLLVVMLWVVLSLFATLPFLTSGSTTSFTAAWFESMSGVTSCGATVFPEVGHLPASVLLWRSMTQWFGGFGIVLIVLAITPRLGINKYALYTAEASGADNNGRNAVRTVVTVRRTLAVYLLLTLFFIVLLLASGMQLWDAVNLTFTNISSGGFSVNTDSIASLTHLQQYILAAAMFFSGVNFSLLYLLFTFRWRQLGHKFDQFRAFVTVYLLAVAFVTMGLHWHSGTAWSEALRLGIVQTVSALTTTGSVVADYTLWWTPLTFVLLMLALTGGMAGSTSGGLKIMRIVILLRNARAILRDRLHPNVVNPVRLNGKPVSGHLSNNVMVIFIVFGASLMLGVMGLMLCGVSPSEAIGASVGCLSGFGPGLGASGGFGSYAHFSAPALWFSSFLMLMGRLECMTLIVLLLPRFWRK
jgi:trk system potassium uptake protein TrkH